VTQQLPLIPAPIALGVCADLLFGRADKLRSRSPESSARRRGPGARTSEHAWKRRQEEASILARLGMQIRAIPSGECEGADPACFAWLVAYLHGDMDARKELLRELVDYGFSQEEIGRLDPKDTVALVRLVVGG